MTAGGDPTGTGRGGASIYGRNFNDEINDELKHTGRPPDSTTTHSKLLIKTHL